MIRIKGVVVILIIVLILGIYASWMGTTEVVSEPASDPVRKTWNDTLSLDWLASRTLNGSDLTLGRVLADEPTYTRYYVTYRSGSLRISGIMNIPKGRGPFPLLILNHGFIPPRIYTNGRGLKREQDYFARRGYAVLHSDYRNHADSDKDTLNDLRWRVGYVEDILNAIDAVKKSDLKSIDKDKIGMLGHSMGGGITMQVLVTHPTLVRAAVLYAPVSADLRDNYYRWAARSRLGDTLLTLYGSPDENPAFWKRMSPIHYFDRIQSPVLVQHGTDDESCPFEWSQRITDSLKALGKEVTFSALEKEKHEFIDRWPLFMQRNVEFFDKHLKNSSRP
jgi:dipeptidyl aminopeptidase/acylaminoacyl peptidase